MKVILLQDVPNVGEKFEVKEVASGFARNFLIQRKLARQATAAAELEATRLKTEREVSEKERAQATLKEIEKVDGMRVSVVQKANEQGGLFSGIDADRISAILAENGFRIPEECIELGEPIKSLGEHPVSLRAGEKKGSFTFVVTAQ